MASAAEPVSLSYRLPACFGIFPKFIFMKASHRDFHPRLMPRPSRTAFLQKRRHTFTKIVCRTNSRVLIDGRVDLPIQLFRGIAFQQTLGRQQRCGAVLQQARRQLARSLLQLVRSHHFAGQSESEGFLGADDASRSATGRAPAFPQPAGAETSTQSLAQIRCAPRCSRTSPPSRPA